MYYTSIEKNIKKYRIERGLRQEALAEMTNLSSNYIGMLERADKLPSLTALINLSNALEVTSDMLLGNFIRNVSDSAADSGLKVIIALASDVSIFSLFFIILFRYCTIKVMFTNIKRGGIMLCQIAVGSLYLFGVPRGYTDGFYGWCKQVIATCLTAFLQTTILYVGLLTFTQHSLLAVGICLSATEVPRIAQMFGLDTSAKVNMMSVSHTVSMGAKAVDMIKGKA